MLKGRERIRSGESAMHFREWHIGLAVVVAAVAFSIGLMVILHDTAPQRGMQPPQYALKNKERPGEPGL
jgi:hypothetical protein